MIGVAEKDLLIIMSAVLRFQPGSMIFNGLKYTPDLRKFQEQFCTKFIVFDFSFYAS